MLSRYDEAEAERAVERSASKMPDTVGSEAARRDLALRVYTSQLLGQDDTLVLHGGGNTSVKALGREVSGDACECLFVKGSGWDLGSIDPPGFPACRLEPLRRLCDLPELSDQDMVRGLRAQLLDPASPNPSVEALLHAFLPGKYVDHTHSDAVLTVVDQPDAAERARAIWGDEHLFVPYTMPGFVLLRRLIETLSEPGAPTLDRVFCMVLEKHGIFTWGDTAQQSYERMIAAVSRAETYLSREYERARRDSVRPPPAPEPTVALEALRRRLSLAMRGALARAPGGRRWVLTWRTDATILDLLEEPGAPAWTSRGTVTPDHVIRTKPWPLWLAEPGSTLDAWAELDDAALQERFSSDLRDYATRYAAYFARHQSRHSDALERLDGQPRVLYVPRLGACTLGKSLKAAHVVGDLLPHTASVIARAATIGEYQPVSEADLFDVEYWSLEQAKLKKGGAPEGSLADRIVLVTGAARGIGLCVATRCLQAGAHVVLSDQDGTTLETSAGRLAERYGARVAYVAADVTTDSVARAFEAAVDHFGGLDVVISNAGTAPSGLLHQPAGDSALRASLEINLLGHQRVAAAAVRLFEAQGLGGVLLFNASKAAFAPGPEFGPYAVAKAALVALMRQYAIDYGRQGIRSNAVNADRIHTELFGDGVLEARAQARGLSPEEYFRQNLLNRETSAEDVSEAFVWLASAEATTGTVITVDGGNPAAFPR